MYPAGIIPHYYRPRNFRTGRRELCAREDAVGVGEVRGLGSERGPPRKAISDVALPASSLMVMIARLGSLRENSRKETSRFVFRTWDRREPSRDAVRGPLDSRNKPLCLGVATRPCSSAGSTQKESTALTLALQFRQ